MIVLSAEPPPEYLADSFEKVAFLVGSVSPSRKGMPLTTSSSSSGFFAAMATPL